MNAKLKRPYVSVPFGGMSSTGGSQMWSDHKVIRRCGCGPVAACDLLLYLEGAQMPATVYPVSRPEYCHKLEKLQKKYYPLLYPAGINGILLVIGMNRMFHDRHLPYRAFWAVSGNRLFCRIHEMLENDIPVILAIGPCFPFIWQKKKLKFYRADRNGCYQRVTAVTGHYVTVLEISDEWIGIASWGRKYYIRISEYVDYVDRYSNFFFSNIVLVEKKAN